MKPHVDFYHRFKGRFNTPSRCKVTIYEDDKINVVLFSDIAEGTSVSDFSAELATQIKSFLTREEVRFFELTVAMLSTDKAENAYREVTYSMEGGQYKKPVSKPFTKTQFEELTGV